MDRHWLYIDRLPYYMTEQRLCRYLSQWGTVTDLTIPKDKSGLIQGHAVICFQSEYSVDAVQKWRPHYVDMVPVITRRMLPPFHERQRDMPVDFTDTVLYVEGLSPVSTQQEMYARRVEIWSAFANLPGTVRDVEINKPVKVMGMWFGLATVHFDDYDAVDYALMREYIMISGVCCKLRSSYQQQQHQQSGTLRSSVGVLMPSRQASNNIPLSPISFGNPKQNLGAARKKIQRDRLRTQTSRPMKEEIDPVRGQIKRKRGATTGSIPSKKQRLSVGLDQATARERDGRVHSLLQKVQLVTNGAAMIAQIEEEVEALKQEEEEKKLKVAALKSVSPAGKGTKIIGDEIISRQTSDKAKTITCHMCDTVLDISKPTSQQERSDVTDTVCCLQHSLRVIKKRKHELTEDLKELKEALDIAEKQLMCPQCKKKQLVSIKKCGHGCCKTCNTGKHVCHVCLVYSKEEIPILCGTGA